MTTSKPYHHGDLRRQLIAVGEQVLAERGLAALSLREVARRLGVSHNAPFKHFASREALLAAMVEAGTEALAERLTAAMGEAAGSEAMLERGIAYVAFALERPALFRLMFGGELDREAFPQLTAKAAASLANMEGRIAATYGEEAILDATISAWATVHGLAMLLLDGQLPPKLRAGRSDLQVTRDVITAMAHQLGV